MARAAKAAATKLAKWMTKTCGACGKEFKVPPRKGAQEFCSLSCKSQHLGRRVCVVCGVAFHTTSRNRRITCSQPCAYRWKSKLQKEGGHSPIRYRDRSKWLAAVTSEQNRAAVSAGNRGLVRSTVKSARYSPLHTRAVECFLRSPDNVVFYVRNITKFVHDNPKLFPAGTVIWKQGGRHKTSLSCAASHGLATVARGFRTSWRGWTVVSGREGRERFDLLARNGIESCYAVEQRLDVIENPLEKGGGLAQGAVAGQG